MSSLHEAARVGFDRSAAAYERGRPSYPAEMVEFLAADLGIGPGTRVLDLGAGTGKLTRLLFPTHAEVLAVEPVAGMRNEFTRLVPGVPILDGTAEAIPAGPESFDVVTVAQAFHWFDHERALPELHRVLRPGGNLVLVWNVRDDERSHFWAGLSALLEPIRGGVPSHREPAWRRALDDSPLFGPPRLRSFEHRQQVTRQDALDRVLSISFVAALAEGDRADVAEAVLRLLDEDPDIHGRDEFDLPYRTDVYVIPRT